MIRRDHMRMSIGGLSEDIESIRFCVKMNGNKQK